MAMFFIIKTQKKTKCSQCNTLQQENKYFREMQQHDESWHVKQKTSYEE